MNNNIDIGYLSKLCLIIALGGFLFGFDTAVISGTISLVKSQFLLDAVSSGWYVSCALMGCIAGVITAGILSDKYGRKKMLIVSGILFLISAIGCAISPTFDLLIISRVIGGVGVGFASILSPMYISEITPAHLRGRMVALYQLAITVGILIAYFSNAYLLNIHYSNATQYSFIQDSLMLSEPWRIMLGSETIPAVIFIILLFLVPKSPRWLVQQGCIEEAKSILQKVTNTENINKQLTEIKASFGTSDEPWKELFSANVRSALFAGVILSLFVQFSGINAIIYYGPEIFERAGFTLNEALGGQVTVGIVNVLFTILAIMKIDNWGRKKLLLTGSCGVISSLLVIAALFYFNINNGMLLISFMLIFIASFAFALGPVNWVILSEIFPNKIRGKAMAVASMSVWIGTLLVGQLFPIMLETLGAGGTFFTFALICFPLLIITMKVLPETKGKTLEEIEQIWIKKSSGK